MSTPPSTPLVDAICDLQQAFTMAIPSGVPVPVIELDREAGYALLREVRGWARGHYGYLRSYFGQNEITISGTIVRWPL